MMSSQCALWLLPVSLALGEARILEGAPDLQGHGARPLPQPGPDSGLVSKCVS